MGTLPAPLTVTDVLLVAVHTELVGLREDLAAARGGERHPASPGEIDIAEPAVQPQRTVGRSTRGRQSRTAGS